MNVSRELSRHLAILGSRGGKRTAAKMTKAQRIERARKAGRARKKNGNGK